MKATIVGGGPVGCLIAGKLRARAVEVTVYEQGPDPRQRPVTRGRSFNVTLTRRGIDAVDADLRSQLYQHGVPLWRRIIHRADGSVSHQPYGTGPEHHLLSLPRAVLHRLLLDAAERAGVTIRFDHDCVRTDPRTGRTVFSAGDGLQADVADLVIGADGANSVVRQEMSRRGARLRLRQEPIEHGYVELTMPPGPDGRHVQLDAGDDGSARHGLHIWPRGDFMLIAQPNHDGSHTATLFLPLETAADRPGFDALTTPSAAAAFFEEHFPDAVAHLPRLREEFVAATASSLRTVRCDPYHHGVTVLMGDAAHTMPPFLGQGINCSFEDVDVFVELFDEARRGDGDLDVARMLEAFTARRKAPGDAVTDLSIANLRELSWGTAQTALDARRRLEHELHARHPQLFTPLYSLLAFTRMPYDQAVALHERQRAPLDRLCQIFDAETQAAQIVDRFAEAATHEPAPPSGSELTLSPEQARHLLDSATSRVLSYRRELDALVYPASYVHDSLDAAAYLQGRSVAADLREDPVPSRGTEVEVLLDELFTKAITNGTLNAHPGFLAHVPSGGLLQGAVGEFIARALNRFGGVWLAAPGLQQIEANVVRWFCTMMGYGPGSFGYLTTGGSMANFMAVVTALRWAARSGPARPILYTSTEAHFSVVKAAALAGMSPDQVSAVGTDPALAMDVAELAGRIRADRAAGRFPAVVVATAGTTNTGAIDDLAAIAELCRAEGLWLHVDACFGGFFRITARGKAALRGIERADSIAVDAHKSLFLPMGSSALLVSDRQHLRSAFEVPGASYLPGFVDDPDLADLCNYGPDLSREIRGLAAWLPLKMHGVGAFERSLDDMLDLAGYLADQVSHLPGIEVIAPHPRHLPVVTFALRGEAGADRDAMNVRLCELICTSGNVYVTTTTIPGHGSVVRACLLNPATDRRVVDRLLDDVARALTRMIGESSQA